LYRTHRARLTRLATAITLDRSLAEEVVQDAFAGLNRHGQHVSNPEGYRRRSVAARHPLAPAPVTNIPELDETWNVVKQLPPRQRAVIVLRYWNDLSEEEIAQTLGWPKGTVKSTLHRALELLRKGLTV
jgi:DNA-directed RNA polymerase specialized sigma24 family protein